MIRYLTIENGIGVLAFALNVWGNIELVRKSSRGWWIRLVAIVCWAAYGFAAMSIPNILNGIVFFGINVAGIRRWRRESMLQKEAR